MVFLYRGSTVMLCSYLTIEHLLPEAARDESFPILAYFYCARNASEPERADLDEIMRSILKQLCYSNQRATTRDPVVTVYKRVKEKALDDGIDGVIDIFMGLLPQRRSIQLSRSPVTTTCWLVWVGVAACPFEVWVTRYWAFASALCPDCTSSGTPVPFN